MFDRVEIFIKAGDGGRGITSFRREKFVPLGGPDGGDGGRGGDVVVRAESSVSNLLQYQEKKTYQAEDGRSGSSQRKHGRKGAGLVLTVPPGTVVTDKELMTGESLVADLTVNGREAVVARGGRGGWGNTHFASSTNQAPCIAQMGEDGEEKRVFLELRLIADVGVIGYPNVGKSSLLATVSAAKPRIASYPFTTLAPVLGVVEVGHKSFVLAEVPGLIQGAHMGRGLGHDFLRHVVRTRVLIHLVDGSSASLVDDMRRVNEELRLFDSALAGKPQLVAVNKIDLPQVEKNLKTITKAFAKAGIRPVFISAASGTGVGELKAAALKLLEEAVGREKATVLLPGKVFRPSPRETAIGISREENVWLVAAPDLERLVAGTDTRAAEARRQLQGQFNRLGLAGVIKRAGVSAGDKIRLGKLEWEW
jgi:GTP-binding protein